jgi:hypothetical protein
LGSLQVVLKTGCTVERQGRRGDDQFVDKGIPVTARGFGFRLTAKKFCSHVGHDFRAVLANAKRIVDGTANLVFRSAGVTCRLDMMCGAGLAAGSDRSSHGRKFLFRLA